MTEVLNAHGARSYAGAMWKYISIAILGIWTIAIFILNWIGILQTARDLFQNRGEVMRIIGTMLTSQWFPLVLFIIAVGVFTIAHVKPTLFKSRTSLDGEIYRLVWAKDASAHARLFLEVQITNNGIPATIVRGYGAHAKLRDGTRLDGKSITIPTGQQMVSGKYKITANKLIYEETTSPIIDGGQAGGWIGFEFPIPMELMRRPDTIITLEFNDARGNRYFVEAPGTGTDTDTKYYPGTGTKIEEIEEIAPQSSTRRFGVRCGTDLYSDNILTGNIHGRYLQAQITVSKSVSACKAYLTEIRGGNRHWQGQEQLTFEPSEAPDSLSKAVFENIKYRLDVLLLASSGEIVVCNHNRVWARWPRLNDIFAVYGPYDLTIDIAGENAVGETFSFRFDRTGNYQTSFLTSAERLS